MAEWCKEENCATAAVIGWHTYSNVVKRRGPHSFPAIKLLRTRFQPRSQVPQGAVQAISTQSERRWILSINLPSADRQRFRLNLVLARNRHLPEHYPPPKLQLWPSEHLNTIPQVFCEQTAPLRALGHCQHLPETGQLLSLPQRPNQPRGVVSMRTTSPQDLQKVGMPGRSREYEHRPAEEQLLNLVYLLGSR